jgi:integrase
MAVYKQPKSKYWWYKFTWNGEAIRESTKQTNKRVAEQMEAAHRTSLAKGEVGIRERKPVPTLARFAEDKFLPFVRATKAEKPRTITFYETTVSNLKSFAKLAGLPLDRINSEALGEFVAFRQAAGMKVSTINRELATVRRVFHLAQEWGDVTTWLPRVRLNPGENSRMRVLTVEEEEAYLNAATELGRAQEKDYEQALRGIRASVRGEQPLKPDAYLLLHIATVLLECGLRPDESYRLKWDQIQDAAIIIHEGKGRGSRRRVPCTSRVMGVLEMRRAETKSEWVFPRATASGHVEATTLKKQHDAAIKATEVSPFVIYDFRHTRITRWAKVLPLPVVQRLAGHTDISTTMRYVHLNDDDVRAAMAKEQEEKGRHTSRHTEQEARPTIAKRFATNA